MRNPGYCLLCIFGLAWGYTSNGQGSTTIHMPRPVDHHGPLNVKYAWSTVDFLYANPRQRDDDILAGNFKPESVVILDGDGYIDDSGKRVDFVTTPSLGPGIPFTLSTVSQLQGEGGLKLKPFPNEKWHVKRGCDHVIVSAFRTKVDKKGRLWVLDTGIEKAFAGRQKRCEPKILVFDLKNDDKLIKSYSLPSDHSRDLTLYVNLEVDVTPEDTFVYLSDPVTMRLAVYSLKKDSSHFVTHPYFFPDPLFGFYELNGVNFTLMDGVFSLALGNSRKGQGHTLYFHSLSGGRECLVDTEILRDPVRAVKEAQSYKTSTMPRRHHVSVEVITKNGIMIFASLEDNALVAWDPHSDYSPRNFKVLVKDRKLLQFPTGMKIVGDELYILTSRLQNVMVGQIAKGETNYRLITAKIDKLLARPPQGHYA